MNQRTKGHVLVILSAVLFGFNPLIAKTVYANGGNFVKLTFLRLFLGTPCLFLIQRATSRASFSLPGSERKKLLLCSFGYALTPVFLLSSYYYISSGMATTIHFIYPVLVLLACAIFFRERISAVKGGSCALCMCGILCFYTPGAMGNASGIALAFISGITYAFYIVYLSKSGLQSLPPYLLGFYLSAFGSIEVAILLLFTRNLAFPFTPLGWCLSIVYAVVSVVATLTFQVGTKYVGPQNASLLSTFEPLTSVIVGVLVFHETIGGRSFIGVLSILLAIALLAAGEKPRHPRSSRQI